MDSVKAAPKLTFAMLMQRIAADPDLSATRKHSLLCSIRTYTKMLGLDPVRMVVDLKGYTDAIKKVRPARHRKTRSRWANVCSDIRAVLRYAGIEGVPGRNLTPPSPAWQALLATVANGRSHGSLARFARWATGEGIEP